MKNLNRYLVRRGTNLVDLSDARQSWSEFRVANGYGPDAPLLTPPDGNNKFIKSPKFHYGVSLAAANSSGDFNTCTWSTPLCRKGCLTYAGRGPGKWIQNARVLKTQWLAEDPDSFVTLLHHEVQKAIQEHGELTRIRLNVFSDLEWNLFAPFLFTHKKVFYDYTKSYDRVLANLGNPRYRLVFSASERTTDEEILSLLNHGGIVNVVFDEVPAKYLGRKVVDIDKDDDCWSHRAGTLLGVKAKGRMRNHEAFIPFIRITKER